MVRVREYKALWEYIQSTVPGITHLFMVDDESELTSKISQVSDGDIILVVVFPSTDSQAFDEDNFDDVDSCVIFLLQKIEQRNIDDADLLIERERTQNLLTSIRLAMYNLMIHHLNSTNHHIMHKLVEGKQHIDRERNYLGCNGWSLSFALNTTGY
jgi:hypothetical protein